MYFPTSSVYEMSFKYFASDFISEGEIKPLCASISSRDIPKQEPPFKDA